MDVPAVELQHPERLWIASHNEKPQPCGCAAVSGLYMPRIRYKELRRSSNTLQLSTLFEFLPNPCKPMSHTPPSERFTTGLLLFHPILTSCECNDSRKCHPKS